ncbi:MAG: hypothetical protein HY809_02695 [Nitrospirae bacterium]|nr:hypothetical protein [Nitrospirota bacterium]
MEFLLTGVDMVFVDGTSIGILKGPVTLRSSEVKGRQVRLGEIYVPEGECKEVRLHITKASIITPDGTASLSISSDTVSMPFNLVIKRRQNSTLFLNWNPDGSVTDNYLFTPLFYLGKEAPDLIGQLLYVTNEDSNNVSVINRYYGKVVGTVLVGKRPRGIAAGLKEDRLRVYVANSGSNSVSVIDPNTNTVEHEIPLRFGREPVAIAVAKGPFGRELVFVANYASGSVSVIDPLSFQELERVGVGNGPVAVAADPPVEFYSGSASLSIEEVNLIKDYRGKFVNVYVANKESNSVSVIRMDMLNNRVEDVQNVAVEWSPVALSVDFKRGKVYVANYGSDRLSVIDIVSLIRGDGSAEISSIENTGRYTVGVATNPFIDRLYLLKSVSSEVLFLNPYSDAGNDIFSVSGSVMGIAATGLSPRSLQFDLQSRNLFVVNSGSDSVSIIDVTTRNEKKRISVGRNPYGVTMFSVK